MTLTQLEAFALVARLGSVTAAARTLGVSEPAVSSALAALRLQLGDRLVERAPSGMVLTEGGRRLVPIASQMVGLALEAEASIRQVRGAPEQLRIVATSDVAESVGASLVAAFTTRSKKVEVSLGVASGEDMAALLQERLADVGLGPRLSSEGSPAVESVPLFRYRMIFVASPKHHLAPKSEIGPSALKRETWLVGPEGGEETSAVRSVLSRLQVPESQIRVFPSHAEAFSTAEHEGGIAPAFAHVVAHDLERMDLCRLPVRGTPLELYWYASMLGSERRSPAASAFQRFVHTPVATHAMHFPLRGVRPSQFRPPVYVTIWS